MKHKNSQSLFAYWNAVRGCRIAPKRFDIEPGRLGLVLPDTFILERSGQGNALVYRLAGTRLCNTFCQDLRGRDFLDGMLGPDRQKLEQHVQSVIAQGAVCVHQIEVGNSSGQTGLLEVLLLPLVHTRDTIDRFLGCIVWLSEPVDLGPDKNIAKRLAGSALVWPDGPAMPTPAVEESSSQAQPRHMDPDRQSPFLPHIRNARIVRQDRRQFRVYDGGLSKPLSEDTH